MEENVRCVPEMHLRTKMFRCAVATACARTMVITATTRQAVNAVGQSFQLRKGGKETIVLPARLIGIITIPAHLADLVLTMNFLVITFVIGAQKVGLGARAAMANINASFVLLERTRKSRHLKFSEKSIGPSQWHVLTGEGAKRVLR